MNPAVMAAVARTQRGPVLLKLAAGTDPRAAGVVFIGDANRTYVDANGIVRYPAVNVPRYAAYVTDRFGLKHLVWLLEGTRQNVILSSAQFDVGWTRVQASVTANAAAAPDGTVTADKLVESTDLNAQHRLDYVTSLPAGSCAYSLFAKAAERTKIFMRIGSAGGNLQFDLLTGAVVVAPPAGYTAGTVALANGWYRCWTAGPCVANETVRVNLVSPGGATTYDGDGVSGAYVWGAQAEPSPNAFPSSHIPTAGAVVTRANEIAHFPFAYAPRAMSVYSRHVELGTAMLGGGAFLHCIGDSSNARLFVDGVGPYRFGHQVNGVTRTATPAPTIALGDVVELVGTVDEFGSVRDSLTVNGAAVPQPGGSGGLAFAGRWSGSQGFLNSATTTAAFGFAAFEEFLVATGARDLSYLRAL